jgi:hypothetical protein
MEFGLLFSHDRSALQQKFDDLMAKLKEHYDTAESDVGFCLVSLNELE